MCRYKSEGDQNGRSDCDSLRDDNELVHGINEKLREEIRKLRESLKIFVHAHSTGNNVPPHIKSAARALLKEVRHE